MNLNALVERLTRDRHDDSLVGLAYLVLTGFLVGLSGPFGLVVGLVIGATWYALGTPYAIAVGHIALVGLFPDGIGLVSFVLVEAAFLTILLAEARLVPYPIQFGGIALMSLVLLGGVAWFGIRLYSLWIAVVLLVTVFAFSLYVIARYERVKLGLVGDAFESSQGGKSGSLHQNRTDGGTPTANKTRPRSDSDS